MRKNLLSAMKSNPLFAISLVLVLAMVGLCGCSQSSPIELPNGLEVELNAQQEGIWVTGEGEMSVTPDIATLRLGVEAQKASVAEAQAEANEAMDKVMKALEEQGVEKKDIQTQYIRIYPVTRWISEKEEEVITGYRVTNTVSAKIRNMDKVGGIIDVVAQAGGDLTRVEGVSFSVEDPSGYYEELRRKAIEDAEAKAKQLAELTGETLGKATYISEGTQQPPFSWIEYDRVGATVPVPAPAPPTVISPGETEISLTVQVAYAILK